MSEFEALCHAMIVGISGRGEDFDYTRDTHRDKSGNLWVHADDCSVCVVANIEGPHVLMEPVVPGVLWRRMDGDPSE